MRKVNLTLIAVFLINLSINAQKNSVVSKKLPTSIYTFSTFTPDVNSFSSLNKRLNLADFKFVFVDAEDLDKNILSIETNSIGKKPSKFIYDDLKRYQNTNLLKGFLRKHDPTRWNLRYCPSNFLPPKS